MYSLPYYWLISCLFDAVLLMFMQYRNHDIHLTTTLIFASSCGVLFPRYPRLSDTQPTANQALIWWNNVTHNYSSHLIWTVLIWFRVDFIVKGPIGIQQSPRFYETTSLAEDILNQVMERKITVMIFSIVVNNWQQFTTSNIASSWTPFLSIQSVGKTLSNQLDA